MYRRVLVPVDGSPTSMAGLDEAIRLAGLTGARLRLMHVLDAASYASGFETGLVYCNEVLPLMKRTGSRILAEAEQRALAAHLDVSTVLVETLARHSADEVVEQARQWQADIIVIGSHGRHGVDRALLGSDAEQVLRRAPVPVLVVRHEVQPGAVVARAAASEAR